MSAAGVKQCILKAADRAALWTALDAAGLTVDGEDGPTVPGTFQEVGIVHAGTGNMLEQDGFEYEETAPVDGWFAVLVTDQDLGDLAALVVTDAPPSVPRFAIPEPTQAEIEAEARTRAEAIKADCAARILEVADERTQGNIAQAGVIYLAMRDEGLTPEQARKAASLQSGDLEVVAAWKNWVTSMQEHCRLLIKGATTSEWPPVPTKVLGLVKRF